MIKLSTLPALLLIFLIAPTLHGADEMFVEAESFESKGGWKVDSQFTHTMGSPYLLAHGMGISVADARTTVAVPSRGTYHLWVRTMDWVPGDWDAPGTFQVIINGKVQQRRFGTEAGWGWQQGLPIEVTEDTMAVALRDLTGFDGRCDALYFCTDPDQCPPNDAGALKAWRHRLTGAPRVPETADTFDVVIVGGGVAGCAAALAAHEQGLKIALVHDRPVLGGNASIEVRVHTLGIYGKGERILKTIDTHHWPNGSAKAGSDSEKRHKTIDAARNVHQFLCWRAYAANTKNDVVTSVDARHLESGKVRRFNAPVFIDCTGDGWIGYWAGAEYRYGREDREEFDEVWEKHGDLWSPSSPDRRVMGASLLWNSRRTQSSKVFPEVPWALDVAKDNAAVAGEWFWEYSTDDKHQINDAEEIRDHLLRAVYGSFFNAKKIPANADVELEWVGFIAGKRESRRLVGDYIFTQGDAISGQHFPDAVAEETREVDVHYQKVLNDKSPYDFISEALFMKTGKYYIPFRCLYSKNIRNLMMAGRCFSCSHIGLGGPRVMRTTGQMGIATGYAAALCKKYDMTPREIYTHHMKELRLLVGYEEPLDNR